MARKDGKDRGLFERKKGSNVWWIRYVDEHGFEVRQKIGPKSEAKAELIARLADVQRVKESRGRLTSRRTQRLFTVSEAIDEYLAVARSQYKDNEYLAAMWKAECGDVPVEHLDVGDLERWMKEKADATSPSTANKYFKFLRRCTRKALRALRIHVDPTTAVPLFPEPPGRVRHLTPKELRALKGAMGDWWFVAELAILTGLRRGNLLALEWAWVDWHSGFLRVPKTKNHDAVNIPLHPELQAALKRIPKGGRYVCHCAGNPDIPLHGVNFTNRHFRPALSKAKIQDFRWHDLRHCFATYMAMAGHPTPVIAKMLGHKDLRMTQRYAHLSDKQLAAAANDLSAAFRKAIAPESPRAKKKRPAKSTRSGTVMRMGEEGFEPPASSL